MKVSLNAIKKYTKVDIKLEDMLDRLTSQVANTEQMEYLGAKYKGILVAEITKKEDHPQADKLAIYQVNVGKEIIQIVTADKLLNVGDKATYLAPGTKVPYNAYPDRFDGIIKAMPLRGVMSNGMLASAKELQISNDHERVLVLDSDAPVGVSFIDYYKLDDYIFDSENKGLTNRPEVFGLIGYARDVSAIQGYRFDTPKWFSYQHDEYKELYDNLYAEIEKAKKKDSTTKFTVKNLVPDVTPRYMLIALDNVKVKPSPLWLQIELMKADIRPINNVVDITNYMMVLTGQPMHAMDYEKCVPDSKGSVNIVVRNAKKGEQLTVIDGKSVELDDEVIVIADDSGPEDVAGVMGGKSSEITNQTKRVLLECANFDMYSIRKTSNRIGVTSDAVTRFARNQDPNMCEAVMLKALEMFKELCGVTISTGMVDIFPNPRVCRELVINIEVLNAHLGTKLKAEEVVKILADCEIASDINGNILKLRIPTYRQDLNIAEDIHEEVARVYGYNKIKNSLPSRNISPVEKNISIELNSRIRKVLAQMGVYDVLTYNFVGKNNFDKCGQDISFAYHIKNSLSPELEYMRTSITPSLLTKVRMNHQSGYDTVLLSEINVAHIKGITDNEELPYEWKLNALVCSVTEKSALFVPGSAFYLAKRYLSELLQTLKCLDVQYLELPELMHHTDLPIWIKNLISLYNHKQTAVVVYEINNHRYYLGVVGEYSGKTKENFELEKYSAGYEINVEELMNIANARNTYREPSKYPVLSQDLCFVADKQVPYAVIEYAMKSELQKDDSIYIDVEPVDIYMNDVSGDKKQVTIRISLQGKDRVLSEEDGDKYRKIIVDSVDKQTGAKLKE